MTQPDLVLLSSGRRVAVHTVAAGTGQRTVLLFHPAPGSANFDPDPTTTAYGMFADFVTLDRSQRAPVA